VDEYAKSVMGAVRARLQRKMYITDCDLGNPMVNHLEKKIGLF